MSHAPRPHIIDLGRLPYADAYKLQLRHLDEVLQARDAGSPEIGRLLLVEHDAVITISRRQGSRANLLATPELLARLGVATAETDRGGDITYHGPGQLVVYPILDLNFLNLGLHAYMRLLESAVIDACSTWGITADRDPAATGVWVGLATGSGGGAKIAAMGVRVKRWASMHGLSFNVNPDMRHFDLLVPCGLAGRKVTSLATELAARGAKSPSMSEVKERMSSLLASHIERAAVAAAHKRLAVRLTDSPMQTD